MDIKRLFQYTSRFVMKHLPKYTAKLLALLVILALMALLCGISWLKTKPRTLPGVTERLAQIITLQGWPYKIEFKKATTRWEEWSTPLMLEVTELDVKSQKNDTHITVPRALVVLRMLPLLEGKVVFKQILLDTPTIAFSSEPDLDSLAPAADAIPVPAPPPIEQWSAMTTNPVYLKALDKLFRILDKPSRIPFRTIQARNATLDVQTPEGRKTYSQEAMMLKVIRSREGNEIRVALGRHVKGALSTIEFRLLEDTADTVWAKLELQNFSTDWLRDVAPEFNWYVATGIAMDGEASALIHRNGTIQSGTLGLTSTPQSSLDFSANGTLDNLDGFRQYKNVPDINLRIDLRNVPVDHLASYWPVDKSVNARTWVTQNLSKGVVTQGFAEIKLPPEMWVSGMLPPDGANAELNFEKLDVKYAPDFPPLTDGSGIVRFTRDTMHVDIKQGKVKETVIKRGSAHIPNLGDPVAELMDIEGDAEGPARDLATFMAIQQKKQGKKVAIEEKKLEGKTAIHFTVHLPLLQELEMKDVVYSLNSTLTGLKYPEIAPGVALTDSDIKLIVKDNVNTISGTVGLNGIPADIDYVTDAREKRELDSNLHLTATPRADELSKLGFPKIDELTGTVTLDYRLKEYPNGESISDITLGAENAAIGVPMLGLSKPTGEPFDIKLHLAGKGGEAPTLKSFDASGKSITVKGTSDIAANGNINDLSLDTLRYGETSAQMRLQQQKKTYNVQLNAEKLDARPLIKYLNRKKDPSKPEEDQQAFSLSARSKVITMANGEVFRDVAGNLTCNTKECVSARLEAKTSDRKMLTLSLTPGVKENIFTAGAGNAGAVLRALDIYTDIREGALSTRAVADATKTDAPYVGSIIIKDFRVVGTPLLAKLLTLGSFTGIIDTLNGQGIAFEKLDSRYSYGNKTYQFDSLKMTGSALGILLSGYADTANSQVKLSGTLVPAYALNNALGKVPLLGNLIVGKGVLATSFTVEGPLDNPRTEVFPLSTIAPGILSDFMREVGIIPSGKVAPPAPAPAAPKKAKKTTSPQ